MDFFRSSMNRVTELFEGQKTLFQVISDLHLDHESQYLTFHIPVAAPYLILGGNIGRLVDYEDYLSFLVRRCNLHEKVFLVLGALEFHGIGWMEGLQLAHKLEQEPKTKGRLEVLYETRSDIPNTNITLLGCTLWSKIPEGDAAAVLKKIPEFDEEKGIKDWTIKEHNSEFKRDHKWLLDELKKVNSVPAPAPAQGVATPAPAPTPADGATNTPPAQPSPPAPAPAPASTPSAPREVIVITSFAPDLNSCLEPWQIDAPWVSAFGTNILAKGDWSSVRIWLSGTTERTCEFEKNGVKFVSNQRGRKGEDVTGLLKDGMSERQKVGLFDVMKVIKI